MAYPMIKYPNAKQRTLAGPIAEQTGYLLMFNEPDLERIPLDKTLTTYREMSRISTRLVLSTGSHLDAEQAWARSLYESYSQRYGEPPRIDALAAHCYFTPDSVGDCMAHVRNVIALARRWGATEVWVTEFGCPHNPDYSLNQCIDATARFVAWMERQDIITRYFFYECSHDPCYDGARWSSLLWRCEEGPRLTEWGRWYRSLK